ncbi:MAG: hypothetical protein H6835_11030 [Planctomycetes bacterium]|nr:hypothetical protein [Planctomycetota bacterium]
MKLPLPILLCAAAVGAGGVLLAQEPTPTQPDAAATPQLPDIGERFGLFVDAQGRVQAEGASWQAHFDAGLVTFETAPHGADQAQPQLHLRFFGAERNGLLLPTGAAGMPTLADDHVRYQRGGLIESYRVDASGIEQSFHVAERPAGHGDLVLHVGTGGNVTAPATERGHQALEFRLGEKRVIRYGEAIAFDRKGHRVDVLTRHDGQGVIDLIVPAAFVDSATFPIVVDPSIGPVFNPGGDTWPDYNPEVAYDLASDTYMVVWQRSFGTNSVGIRGELFHGDGVSVTGGWVAISNGAIDQGDPSVAFCDSLGTGSFLVVWRQGTHITGRHMSLTGAAMSNELTLSSPAAGDADSHPCVAGPGTGGPMTIAYERSVSGATNPDRIMLRTMRWSSPANPNSVTLSAETVVQTLAASAGHVRNPRLGRSCAQVNSTGVTEYANRLIWDRWWTSPAPGDWDIFTCSFRVHPTTQALTFIQTAATVSGADAIGVNELTGDIASRAELFSDGANMQFCIVWEEEADVHGRMYSLTAPLSAEFTVANDPVNFEGMPAVGAGHCEFTVAYGEIIPPDEFAVNIRGARVLLDGTVAINQRNVDVLNGPFQASLCVSSRPIQTTSWMETNTTLITWYGETGPAGGLADIRARFFEPNAPHPSLFGSACPGPAGEMASIGYAGGEPIQGNSAFQLTVSGAPPVHLAVLVVSDQLTTTPIPGAPGCNLYAGLPAIGFLPALTDAAGSAAVNLPLPCSIPHSATLAFQWAIYTPGHNAFGWIVSNDQDIPWSHL